ncbi:MULTISPECIES: hypothetical protein [unclassified Exiguobacterium]|uniref:hypothetical protein n=1 Tax=unclassified Exiguobacterium TaxID=2644629 RepID=UPI001BE85491|nr:MULTISPECIES: hypothetical protein [unclassified Exiguobacterium]
MSNSDKEYYVIIYDFAHDYNDPKRRYERRFDYTDKHPEVFMEDYIESQSASRHYVFIESIKISESEYWRLRENSSAHAMTSPGNIEEILDSYKL